MSAVLSAALAACFPPPVATNGYDVEVFLVAAGGGGGLYYYDGSGGGGGGRTLKATVRLVPGTIYPILIPAGGAGGQYDTGNATDGGNATFAGLTALGGKGGRQRNGGDGGSGGAAGGQTTVGDYWRAAAGGSDGSNGESAFLLNGNQSFSGGLGQGTTTREFGDPARTLYSGGGGSGVSNFSEGPGGLGGGGNGESETDAVHGSPGAINTGGGGGGGSTEPGWAGGSGRIVIRYPGAQRFTGGTVSSSGGYTYHHFNASTSITA